MKRILNAIKNEAGTHGTLTIYGTIVSESWFDSDVTPKDVKAELDRLSGVETIDVYINSPGGDVWSGMAIYEMLKRADATIVTHIDGMAASAAATIFQAGETRHIPKNAFMFIHNPWGCVCGYASDMRKMADDLDKYSQGINETFDKFTGTDKELIALMDAETLLVGAEAVELGLADVVDVEVKMAASLNKNILNINGVELNMEKHKSVSLNKLAVNFLNSKNKQEGPPPKPEAPDYGKQEMQMNETQMKINKIHIS